VALPTPYIIVEVKKPKRKDGLEQLKSYCNAEGSPIGVWTNGAETICLHREEPNIFRNLSDIPEASQTLSALLAERWTLEDLEKNNKLVTERTSLRDIILDMENLVLANAGVDAFEEVFKLVYAKLFDEWSAARGGKKKRYLEFRLHGQTSREFSESVDTLFKRAQQEPVSEAFGRYAEGVELPRKPCLSDRMPFAHLWPRARRHCAQFIHQCL
jgi:type I restriction enzyme M protein